LFGEKDGSGAGRSAFSIMWVVAYRQLRSLRSLAGGYEYYALRAGFLMLNAEFSRPSGEYRLPDVN